MYKLIDSGDFQKFEQVGAFKIVRPSPQAVWKPDQSVKEWVSQADAHYERYSNGKGDWKIKNKKIEQPFTMQFNDIQMIMKLTSFGHLGVFVEQVPQWLRLQKFITAAKKNSEQFRVLNLFAYTGGATLSCLQKDAEVVHLDASKSSVEWARNNARASGLEEKKARWIVDDVQKFVQKEVRRGSQYEAIILDPPSFGRGTKNEVWKIEDHLLPLLDDLKKLMSENFAFMQLSSHSQGYTPLALKNLLSQVCASYEGVYEAEEMIVQDQKGKALPSGAHCFFISKKII
jgi:23S rRNA (cytosine1962-C5)-methyltransferase